MKNFSTIQTRKHGESTTVRSRMLIHGVQRFLLLLLIIPISGREYRASTIETVDLSLIPGRVKPKSLTTGMHSFLA